MLYNTFYSFTYLTLDLPEDYQIGFQDPASNVMEGLINFHHDIMTYLAFISVFVLWFLIRIITHFNDNKLRVHTINHDTLLEIVWTVLPALILITIGTPSFALLYTIDEISEPIVALKVIGHQWYWFYEYPSVAVRASDADLYASEYKGTPAELNNIDGSDALLTSQSIESHMLSTPTVDANFRLAEVTEEIVLPTKSNIKIVVTSADALHSWAVPSLAIKMDACPGRLNQLWTNIKRYGIYYGQCSEICGVNHAFMPITIEGVRFKEFLNWQIINSFDNTIINKG